MTYVVLALPTKVGIWIVRIPIKLKDLKRKYRRHVIMTVRRKFVRRRV